MDKEFSRLKSIEVVVEERQVALQITRNTWRTHVFTGLDTIPEKLSPSFTDGESSDRNDLELMELVRKSYRTGKIENRFEAPYRLGGTSKGPTVLRSVMVTIRYGKCNEALEPLPNAGVGRPMISN